VCGCRSVGVYEYTSVCAAWEMNGQLSLYTPVSPQVSHSLQLSHSVNVAHKLFNTLPLVAIKKSTYWWKVLPLLAAPRSSDMRHCIWIRMRICIWICSYSCSCLYLYLLYTLGTETLPLTLPNIYCSTFVFGGTASFVCVTLLDSWIACLVFEQFMRRAPRIQAMKLWETCRAYGTKPCVGATLH